MRRDDLEQLLSPICRKWFGKFNIGLQDREDIGQEVYLRVFGRMSKNGLGLRSVHYIRKTAWFEARKLCCQIAPRRSCERSLEHGFGR